MLCSCPAMRNLQVSPAADLSVLTFWDSCDTDRIYVYLWRHRHSCGGVLAVAKPIQAGSEYSDTQGSSWGHHHITSGKSPQFEVCRTHDHMRLIRTFKCCSAASRWGFVFEVPVRERPWHLPQRCRMPQSVYNRQAREKHASRTSCTYPLRRCQSAPCCRQFLAKTRDNVEIQHFEHPCQGR